MFDILSYFTDPVLRGPTIGSILMCVTSSIMGVIVYLQKRALIGETLSHAAYPGVIVGLLCSVSLFHFEEANPLLALLGGAITGSLALYFLGFLTKRFNIKSDSALCIVLASFFGIGILLISMVQLTHGGLYKQAEGYLFGQAATMGDIHITLYFVLALIVALAVTLLYKELQLALFDANYAKILAIPSFSSIIFVLIVTSIVVGIRSVGVILMSAMLIAPAVSARQFVHKLSHLFWLSPLFGSLSAFLGNVFSYEITKALSQDRSGGKIVLPTGPTIVLVASSLCLLSLLFAPKRGLVSRLWRIASFRMTCAKENLLKYLWRHKNGSSEESLYTFLAINPLVLRPLLLYTRLQGWIDYEKGHYRLSKDGEAKAARIVRLHRLWEVYLVDYVGLGARSVHSSAEEMEHILTPELESELTKLLKDPIVDPHQQPIPPKGFLR